MPPPGTARSAWHPADLPRGYHAVPSVQDHQWWSPGIGKLVTPLYKLAAKQVISSTKIRPWPGRVRLPDRDNQ
jgi:hypothetical protein